MKEARDTSVPLAQLGFDAFFEQQVDSLEPGLFPARIVGQHRREWDVRDAVRVQRAVLAGRRWSPSKGGRSDEIQPTIGDWVALSQKEGQPPVIEHILTRKTYLARTSVARRGERQVIVANVDVVAVVSAFSAPETSDAVARRSLHPRRIERYLAAIQPGGAEGIVVVNKADLRPDTQSVMEELRRRLAGAKVISVSAKSPEGLASLRELLSPGKTIGFVGLSGVGKSSIVNAVLGNTVQRVQEAREDDSRGRHTTTHRSLFVTEEGYLLIDTPGMREFAISETDDCDLSSFTDIAQLAANCRFRNCSHASEPGCAVVSAVNSGVLSLDRLTSFRELAQELSMNGAADPAQRPHPRAQAPRPSGAPKKATDGKGQAKRPAKNLAEKTGTGRRGRGDDWMD